MADVHSAGKKPQMYKDEQGKMKVRMVPSKQDVKSEKTLTPAEKRGRERIAKKLPMKDFKKRYGDDAMAVKMATATKIAKKKYEGDNETSGMDETKAAPKGYHFTASGKLRKGDADADGPGGKKLRADPLDKQRSKIPPLPEEVEENYNWKVSHAGKDVHVKAPHAGAAVKKAQKGFGNMDLTKAKITNLGKVGMPAKEEVEEVFSRYSSMPSKRQIGRASDEPNYNPAKMNRRPSMSAKSLNKKLYGKAMGSSLKPEYEATDKPPFEGPYKKKDEPTKDQYGNVVKKKNVAQFLAKKGMKKAMGEDKQQEGMFDRVGDKVAKAKKAIANGMPKHVAMAKYLVTSKDLGEAQVDEISTDLKKRYVDKAKSDYKHQQYSRAIGKEMGADKDTLKHYTRKMQKRMGGIGRATATMGESVEEAKSFDQKFKDRLKFTTSKSKSVQDYMKKKAGERDAMNKANDPNAARKGYALSAVPPERAYQKARKKGMDPYKARQAASSATRSLGGTKYRGRKLPEETQLDEVGRMSPKVGPASYTAPAKELKAYAQKSGGIDKNDFMQVADMLMQLDRINILQAGQVLSKLNAKLKSLDTSPREKILSVLDDHGHDVGNFMPGAKMKRRFK